MKEYKFIVNHDWISPVFYYEELNDCIAKLWKDVFRLFTKFEMKRNQHFFYISIDWRELQSVITHDLKYNISLSEYRKMDVETKAEYYNQINDDSNRVSLKCKVETNSIKLNTKMVSYYLELFFFELFSVMNLSGPGCCNFSKTSISDTDGNVLIDEMDLSSHFFEHSWDIYLEEHWPVIKYIPLEISWTWYQSLNIGTKQLAETSTEIVLFALLSISKNSNFEATNVIWLAHALEALYGNPKKNIKQLLIARICIVLNPENHNIESKITKFYRYRSNFVHGKFGAKNPINNSLFDIKNKLLDYDMKLNNETDFSIAIVLSTLQQMILKNWVNLDFSN